MGIVETLERMGYQVSVLSDCHLLVEGQLDVWLPRGKWHDRVTGVRGQKPLDQIPFLIKNLLEDIDAEQTS